MNSGRAFVRMTLVSFALGLLLAALMILWTGGTIATICVHGNDPQIKKQCEEGQR